MVDLQKFDFHSNQIRVIEIENNPWFVAKDICDVLGYRDPFAGTRYLDEDEKLLHSLSVAGQIRETTIINESGLYSLVLRSNKPEAKVFKKWVTYEVLPTIRKHGAYLTPEKTDELLRDPDLIIKMATQIKEERNRNIMLKEFMANKDAAIKSMSPKAEYYDKVLSSEDGIVTSLIAKEVGMSANHLNKILHEKGVIYKVGGSWVLYSKYQNKGLTKTRTHLYFDTEGNSHSRIQLVWTEYGREFIHTTIKGAN